MTRAALLASIGSCAAILVGAFAASSQWTLALFSLITGGGLALGRMAGLETNGTARHGDPIGAGGGGGLL